MEGGGGEALPLVPTADLLPAFPLTILVAVPEHLIVLDGMRKDADLLTVTAVKAPPQHGHRLRGRERQRASRPQRLDGRVISAATRFHTMCLQMSESNTPRMGEQSGVHERDPSAATQRVQVPRRYDASTQYLSIDVGDVIAGTSERIFPQQLCSKTGNLDTGDKA